MDTKLELIKAKCLAQLANPHSLLSHMRRVMDYTAIWQWAPRIINLSAQGISIIFDKDNVLFREYGVGNVPERIENNKIYDLSTEASVSASYHIETMQIIDRTIILELQLCKMVFKDGEYVLEMGKSYQDFKVIYRVNKGKFLMLNKDYFDIQDKYRRKYTEVRPIYMPLHISQSDIRDIEGLDWPETMTHEQETKRDEFLEKLRNGTYHKANAYRFLIEELTRIGTF